MSGGHGELRTMLGNAWRLLWRGKLLRDPAWALRRWALGCLATAAVVLGLTALDIPPGPAVMLAALAGGAWQTWLFRNLRYA